MAKKHQKVDTLQLPALIKEGQDITKSTHFGVYIGPKEKQKFSLATRYEVWKDECEEFLRNENLLDEADYFSEGDEVPQIIGGLAYGDPLSPQSLSLAKTIRQETSKKLQVLRKVRLGLEKKYRNQSVAEIISTSEITLIADRVFWKNKDIPLERGQRAMFGFLFKEAKVYRGKRLIKKGEELNRLILQKEGRYENEAAFRDALGYLRRKLKAAKFPLQIDSFTTNHYLMTIWYELE